jgi:pyridoxal 5'-phosphate synthase pdxS subunit
VQAVTHWDNPQIIAEVRRDLGEPMVGINVAILPKEELMAVRGW